MRLRLGAPLLSVFSLHGFVCESETFQESHSQLDEGEWVTKTQLRDVHQTDQLKIL